MAGHSSTLRVVDLSGLHRFDQYYCYICIMFRLNGILIFSFVGLCLTNPTPQKDSTVPQQKVNTAKNPKKMLSAFLTAFFQFQI